MCREVVLVWCPVRHATGALPSLPRVTPPACVTRLTGRHEYRDANSRGTNTKGSSRLPVLRKPTKLQWRHCSMSLTFMIFLSILIYIFPSSLCLLFLFLHRELRGVAVEVLPSPVSVSLLLRRADRQSWKCPLALIVCKCNLLTQHYFTFKTTFKPTYP